MDKYGHFEPAR